jgi:hypothetical protein
MLIFVITINLVISAVNFYLVWRLKKLRAKLIILTKDLNILADHVQIIFSLGEEFLEIGTIKARNFRANYGKIENKIKLVRQLLILVNLINKFKLRQVKP